MALYSVGDVTVALGVSTSTIRNWTENPLFEPYLSSKATRKGEFEHAKQREYTEEDLVVLNTIRTQKTRTNSWEDVARLLEEGTRDKNLPESAALVMPATQAENFQLLVMAKTQIENLQARLEVVEGELEEEREGRRADNKLLSDEKNELWRTIGKLENKLEWLEDLLKEAGIDPKTGRKSN